jgi:hypothetical protein
MPSTKKSVKTVWARAAGADARAARSIDWVFMLTGTRLLIVEEVV